MFLVEGFKMEERRSYKRYQVGDNAFVFGAEHPGKINNISLAGMSFSHLCEDTKRTPDRVTILDPKNEFFMEQIPCRLVSRQISHGALPTSTMHTSHVRVAFLLDANQRDSLESYITSSAVNNA